MISSTGKDTFQGTKYNIKVFQIGMPLKDVCKRCRESARCGQKRTRMLRGRKRFFQASLMDNIQGRPQKIFWGGTKFSGDATFTSKVSDDLLCLFLHHLWIFSASKYLWIFFVAYHYSHIIFHTTFTKFFGSCKLQGGSGGNGRLSSSLVWVIPQMLQKVWFLRGVYCKSIGNLICLTLSSPLFPWLFRKIGKI